MTIMIGNLNKSKPKKKKKEIDDRNEAVESITNNQPLKFNYRKYISYEQK